MFRHLRTLSFVFVHAPTSVVSTFCQTRRACHAGTEPATSDASPAASGFAVTRAVTPCASKLTDSVCDRPYLVLLPLAPALPTLIVQPIIVSFPLSRKRFFCNRRASLRRYRSWLRNPLIYLCFCIAAEKTVLASAKAKHDKVIQIYKTL
jgi:hypothetical protein